MSEYLDKTGLTYFWGKIKEKFNTMITEKASTDHNSIYQKKDITAWFRSGELWTRIANDFDGIYPGQYFDCGKTITANGSSKTGTSMILIAGCNVHWNTHDEMRYNHITCVPVTHFGLAHMNPSDTSVGGYWSSDMNQSIIGGVATSGGGSTINSQLFGVFGSHLKTSTELLSKAIDANRYNRFGTPSGTSSDWGGYPVQAVLMSEIEVYGSTVWSSSGYDTGTAKVQMPAFRYNTKDMIPDNVYYWLKDVASSTYFCFASDDGGAKSSLASLAYPVRPRFILGK